MVTARLLPIVLLVLLVPATALAAEQKQVKPDRAAVTALLDQFVPDVVAQKDLRHGWDLVAGYERTTSHAEWLKGNTSVQSYPAKGSHFPGWLVNYSYPGDVGFDLLLQPTNPKLGAWSFRAEAKRIGGRWRIVSWYPVATFAPAGRTETVLGPNDLGPANAAVHAGDSGSRLPAWVLATPLLGLGGLAVGGAIVGGTRWARRRARIRAIEETLAR
jgi:hypothetical protein